MRNIKRLACMGEGKRVSDGERRDCELQRQKMPFETNSICLVLGWEAGSNYRDRDNSIIS